MFINNIKQKKENLVKDFCKIHGSKYDYSLVEYQGAKTNITIICTKHGAFTQRPDAHKKGSGCPQCFIELRKNTKENFIKQSNLIHNNKYDYSLFEYINASIKSKIICPIKNHGVFIQTPNNHKNNKQGCPKCYGNEKTTYENFYIKATLNHNNKYQYPKWEDYKNINVRTKIKIFCPKHGHFMQMISNHLHSKKYGCHKCSENKISKGQKELFEKIKKQKPNKKIIIEHCVETNNKKYFVDIFILETNTIIEYYGDYWHCNPTKYNSNYWHKQKKKYAFQIWKDDELRKKELENLGYKIVIIWESDFKQNKITYKNI